MLSNGVRIHENVRSDKELQFLPPGVGFYVFSKGGFQYATFFMGMSEKISAKIGMNFYVGNIVENMENDYLHVQAIAVQARRQYVRAVEKDGFFDASEWTLDQWRGRWPDVAFKVPQGFSYVDYVDELISRYSLNTPRIKVQPQYKRRLTGRRYFTST